MTVKKRTAVCSNRLVLWSALSAAQLLSTQAHARPAFENADFEQGTLQGWGKKPEQSLSNDAVTCQAAQVMASATSIPHRPSLGGNYWDVPVTATGGMQSGHCRLFVSGPTPAWSTLGIYSPPFTLQGSERYLSFLLENSEKLLGISIVDEAGAMVQRVPVRTGQQHIIVDLRQGAKTKGPLRVFIARGLAAVAVDDFRLEASAPAPVRPQPSRLAQLYGFADLHVHLFTQVGFGGRMFHGSIHSCIDHQGRAVCDRASIAKDALGDCGPAHGVQDQGVKIVVPEGGHLRSGYAAFEGWPSATSISHQQMYVDWLRRAWEGGLRLVHMDVVNSEVMADLYNLNARVMKITDQPLRNDTGDDWNIQQQLQATRNFARLPDVKTWLEIAETPADARRIVGQGKLAVVLGVELDDLGGFNSSRDFWKLAREAESDEGAREQVRMRVRTYLEGLYRQGVRHIFPVHVFDNPFGGTAVSEPTLEIGQYLFFRKHHGSGRFISTYDARSNGVRARHDLEVGQLRSLVDDVLLGTKIARIVSDPAVFALALPIILPFLHAMPGADVLVPGLMPAVKGMSEVALAADKEFGIKRAIDGWKVSASGNANTLGLTRAGHIFVEEAMRLGMIIDVSHMSARTTDNTLALAETYTYPIIAGHGGFHETSFGTYKGSFHEQGYLQTRIDAADVRWDSAPGREQTQKILGTANPAGLANERGLRRDQIERISKLGGMLGVGVGPGATPVKLSSVAPNCDGSSKSWVQSYAYAVATMDERGVALGTDANGFVAGVVPRFGPKACAPAFTDEVRSTYARAQVNAQANGVAYRYVRPNPEMGNGIRASFHARFTGPSAASELPPSPDEPWNTLGTLLGSELRDLRPARAAVLESEWSTWAALARFWAGNAPRNFSAAYGCSPVDRGMDRDAARTALGFWMAAAGKPAPSTDFGCAADSMADIKEAYNVYKGLAATQDQALHDRMQAVWGRAQAMRGDNPPLQKSVLAGRDFDFNIDGQAHYGMLPDLLQDVRNAGLSADDLAPLFRSANDYVVMWEAIEVAKLRARGEKRAASPVQPRVPMHAGARPRN